MIYNQLSLKNSVAFFQILAINFGRIRANTGVFAAYLTGTSKAFDCIPYTLITAKLGVYCFDKKSLNLTDLCQSRRLRE